MTISEITCETLTRMLSGAANLLIANRDHLGKLDAAIGDGDHGVTIERAMKIVLDQIKADKSGEMSRLLEETAWALMDCDGGATGPLYGSLFLGMSNATAGKTALDAKGLADMLGAGLRSIQEQSKAKVGDKTMMDALIPAVEAAQAAAEGGASIETTLQDAAVAAKKGSDYTATIPARFGRAKFQGERTIGHPDPGSVSVSLWFQGLLDSLA
jgi:dihydroxyacetone kinase-like protein